MILRMIWVNVWQFTNVYLVDWGSIIIAIVRVLGFLMLNISWHVYALERRELKQLILFIHFFQHLVMINFSAKSGLLVFDKGESILIVVSYKRLSEVESTLWILVWFGNFTLLIVVNHPLSQWKRINWRKV